MHQLTPKEKILYRNYYNLSQKDKIDIIHRKKVLGMTIDEIARRFEITPPDVNRILNPPKNYGNWTAEEKQRHWFAGKKRAETVKKQRNAIKNK